MAEFTHLHLHTEYSLLDGACRIDSLFDRVKEYGQKAVAITDHGVMYGAIDFYKAAKKHGIKPIIGCEVYVANEDGARLWDAVFAAGEEFGISPIGLGARDTLRLEMGFCLYGNDIDDTTSPIEAGLGWITKFNDVKGDFIDKDYMLQQKADGLKRKLVGFELIDKGIPRHGYNVCNADGEVIGVVTSGTMAPTVKKGVGLAYVNAPLFKVGSEIFIEVRGKMLKAEVVKTPFYKK